MISIKKINDKMINLSKPKFIVTILALDYIISVMFIPIINLYENYIGSIGGPDHSNFKIVVIGSIIIAPLLETLVFQMGIIKLLSLSEKFKNKKLILIIISAFFFGLSHGIYSTLYMICTFTAGILLAYSFIVYEEKENSGFWVTTIIHSLMNLITFVF
ncbi:CPBP family intramembrane metalloprotease [Clostridium sporogenes]|uniref:CPBP family intramembrane glutamic endopeptidase n=1 Tax=Clostridium sporogenes TaxID=1509 RepID=UPI001C0FFDA2|nr:CPBP family intramembrane glutamic endopeptidase [Clostridium sporogenes]MBU5299390.1 CPBP family intramembrane metalloprotease [Clostridium sporogenes]